MSYQRLYACYLDCVQVGQEVLVAKQGDGGNGPLFRGFVKEVKGKTGFDSRGILVRLRSGMTGRVQIVCNYDDIPPYADVRDSGPGKTIHSCDQGKGKKGKSQK